MVAKNKIDADVLTILSEMECDGDLALKFPKQLDRKLYERLNKVLESLGGKWNRKRNGHVFANGDAAASLEAALQFGEYIDPKKAFQDFATPNDLADKLVMSALVGSVATDPVLEPSCGDGAIVDALIRHGCENIHVYDIRHGCIEKMKGEAEVKRAVCLDFLALPPSPKYQAVVMNPPFCKANDMAHVAHAYQFLRKGGVLVAVMSPGFIYRSDRKATEFRTWAEAVGAKWRDNPEGSFVSSGTNVNTVTFTVSKA